MTTRQAIRPPPSAIYVCPECEGDGVILASVRLAFCCDDGLENVTCPRCGGTGECVDYDRLAYGVRDTVPAPAPDGCESEVA